MHVKRVLFLLFIMMIAFALLPTTSNAADIVNPKQTYTYDKMVRDIKALEKKYPDLITYKIIGYSEYNRAIYAVSLGTGNATTFINGSHHAREWISTNLNMEMIEQYAKKHKANQTFGGFNVQKVLDETTIWFVPMVNPDGVTLQQLGLSKFPTKQHYSLIRANAGSTNFKKWKANAKGVDLNRQYNANWNNIKNNVSNPWWQNHKGMSPVQASEVIALSKFTKEINPEMAVSYHSSGEVLYWDYKQTASRYNRDHAYAKKIAQYTGYKLIYPGSNPSGGGYTDWFISTFKRPAFTPELAPYAGNTHVPLTQFNRIWQQNQYIGLYTASEGYKLYLARGGQPKEQEVNISIDGKKTTFAQPALIMNGNTVVPVRGVFEHLGATVEWNDNTKTVVARKGMTYIELKLGSKTMTVNNGTKTLTIAPLTHKNTTMIPLRAVSEALGAGVGWNQKTSTAEITSKDVIVDTVAPNLPTISTVTDITEKITGTAEINSIVKVIKDGNVIGHTQVNGNGKYSINISAQVAESKLSVTATDLAGNTSGFADVIVSYTSTFTDTIGHWATDSIGYLKDEKITDGLPDGSFGVNNPISRGEAATLIVRALKLDMNNQTELPFTDVTKDYMFYSYISAVYINEIMTGVKPTLFKPKGTLTRAEMAAILVNAFDLQGTNEKTFKDVPQKHWAFDSIHILAANKYTNGYADSTFRPDNSISRAEFATMLVNVLQNPPPAEQELVDGDSVIDPEQDDITPGSEIDLQTEEENTEIIITEDESIVFEQ